MMVSTTKRRFKEEFKHEAVPLWETSCRMQTEVAAELGIMPTIMASSADQASEIARLRRELDGHG